MTLGGFTVPGEFEVPGTNCGLAKSKDLSIDRKSLKSIERLADSG